MAPTVPFDERKRQLWSGAVMALGCLGLPVAVCLLSFAVYVRLVVDEELELVQGLNTATLPAFLAVTGTINFVSNLLLVSAMASARPPSSRQKSLGFLQAATLLLLLSTLLLLSAAIYALVKASQLAGDFSDGLGQAMSSYPKDGDVKTRLDILQMDWQCCGDAGYQDWFSVHWISEDVLVADMKEVQSHEGGEPYVNDDVPFSCCDPNATRPCIHHHVHTPSLHYNYDHEVDSTLYSRGCREALMDYFGHSLLQPIGFSLLALSLLQLAMVAVCRLLQTSMQEAVNNDDITGPAVGYLLAAPPKGKEEDKGEGKPLLSETDSVTSSEGDTVYDDISVTSQDGGDSFPHGGDDELLYENLPYSLDPSAHFRGVMTTTPRSQVRDDPARSGLHPAAVAQGYSADYPEYGRSAGAAMGQSTSERYAWGTEPDAADPNLYEPISGPWAPDFAGTLPEPEHDYVNEARDVQEEEEAGSRRSGARVSWGQRGSRTAAGEEFPPPSPPPDQLG